MILVIFFDTGLNDEFVRIDHLIRPPGTSGFEILERESRELLRTNSDKNILTKASISIAFRAVY